MSGRYFTSALMHRPQIQRRGLIGRSMLVGLGSLLLMLLSGCGFQLRGISSFPFDTLHIVANSPVAIELKRNLRAASTTRLVEERKEAAAVLEFNERRDKTVLSIGNTGRAREFRLNYVLTYRVVDQRGREMVPLNSNITIFRDISFNDTQVLSKESEEALLWREMQSDMVQQLIRRLAAARVRADDEQN
jgi:LPS-assembly lipoprotein